MRAVIVATWFAALAILCTHTSFGLAQGTKGRDQTNKTKESKKETERLQQVVAETATGSVKIRLGDLESAINSRPVQMRESFREKQTVRSLLSEMVDVKLLAEEALRQELDKLPAVSRTISENAIQELIHQDYDNRFPPESISKKDIRAYYEKNLGEYRQPEMRRARHILLGSEAEAKKLLTELQGKSSAAFGEYARDKSLDSETRERGGDLRYFDADGAPPNPKDPHIEETIAAAAFKLERVGELSPSPLKVEDKWSIIMLTGLRVEQRRTVEDVADNIRMTLWRQARKSHVDTLVARLRAKNGIETHPERLKWIKLDPAPKGPEGEGFPTGGSAG